MIKRTNKAEMIEVPAGFIADAAKRLHVTREELAQKLGYTKEAMGGWATRNRCPIVVRQAINGLLAEQTLGDAETAITGPSASLGGKATSEAESPTNLPALYKATRKQKQKLTQSIVDFGEPTITLQCTIKIIHLPLFSLAVQAAGGRIDKLF